MSNERRYRTMYEMCECGDIAGSHENPPKSKCGQPRCPCNQFRPVSGDERPQQRTRPGEPVSGAAEAQDIAVVALERAIHEARNRTGMRVGLPNIALSLDKAERLLKLLSVPASAPAAAMETGEPRTCRNCGQPEWADDPADECVCEYASGGGTEFEPIEKPGQSTRDALVETLAHLRWAEAALAAERKRTKEAQVILDVAVRTWELLKAGEQEEMSVEWHLSRGGELAMKAAQNWLEALRSAASPAAATEEGDGGN